VAAHAQVPAVAGILYGVQPEVIAIVAEAVIRIGRRTLSHVVLAMLAAAAFVAIYFFAVPFPLIVAAAAGAGALLARALPDVFSPRGEASQVAAPPVRGAPVEGDAAVGTAASRPG